MWVSPAGETVADTVCPPRPLTIPGKCHPHSHLNAFIPTLSPHGPFLREFPFPRCHIIALLL